MVIHLYLPKHFYLGRSQIGVKGRQEGAISEGDIHSHMMRESHACAQKVNQDVNRNNTGPADFLYHVSTRSLLLCRR